MAAGGGAGGPSGHAPGRRLAGGRDADIFEYGPRLVLRRSRSGRSLELEARTMEYARANGYPAPAVESVSDDGCEVVMQRVDGPDVVTLLSRRPWRARRWGRTLGELQARLHDLAAPDWVTDCPIRAGGDRLLHLDFHPQNVLVGRSGPVVIDWANACRGTPAFDVALTWLLISAGDPDSISPLLRPLLVRCRDAFVGGFAATADVGPARSVVGDVAAWKSHDPNMSPAEVAAMGAFARREGGRG